MPTRRDFLKTVCGAAALTLGPVLLADTAVVRTGRRTYRAIDLRCTHQGVTVGKSGTAWQCPAHGSKFAVDGTVTGGPAQRSLSTVKSIFANGRLTVG